MKRLFSDGRGTLAASQNSSATSSAVNVLLTAALLLACSAHIATAVPIVPDADSILRESLEAGDRNVERRQLWLSESRKVQRVFEPDGSLKSDEIKTYDYIVVGGIAVRKLIARNDKPLDADEQKKEDQRVARIVETRRNETSWQRERRLAEAARKKQKDRDFNNEIAAAFHFKLLGEETINGRKAWLIEATPRPDFKPKDMRAGIFPHVRGKIWIDRQDHLWAKAEADAFEPISIGFSILAKLDQGAHLFFEQARMEDGTWMLSSAGVRAGARIALVKRVSIDQSATYRNFRRVPAGAVVDETEVK